MPLPRTSRRYRRWRAIGTTSLSPVAARPFAAGGAAAAPVCGRRRCVGLLLRFAGGSRARPASGDPAHRPDRRRQRPLPPRPAATRLASAAPGLRGPRHSGAGLLLSLCPRGTAEGPPYSHLAGWCKADEGAAAGRCIRGSGSADVRARACGGNTDAGLRQHLARSPHRIAGYSRVSHRPRRPSNPAALRSARRLVCPRRQAQPRRNP